MANLFYTLNATILIIAASTSAAWAGRAYFYDATGAVSVAIGKNKPQSAGINDPVTSGTVIRTGTNGHAVLKFDDGQVISLQASTTFKVREYIFNPSKGINNSAIFSLFNGSAHFVSGQIVKSNPKAFRLATPRSTLTIKGAEFHVVVAKQTTYIQVISGSVRMTNSAGSALVKSGQAASTSSENSLATTVSPSTLPTSLFSTIAAIAMTSPTPVSAPTAQALEAELPPTNPMQDATSMESASTETKADVVDTTIPTEEKTYTSPDKSETSSSDTRIGLYIGAQAGPSKYNYGNVTNNSKTGYSLLAGYSINENFAAEVHYSDLGGFDSTQSTLKGSAYGISGVGYYPLNDQFKLFAKLGISNTKLKETPKPGFTGSFTHPSTGVSFGLGGQYNFNSTVGIRMGLDIHPIKHKVSGKATDSMIYLGGIVAF